MTKKNILILGADGMVGNTIFTYLSLQDEFNTLGTSRKKNTFSYLDIKSFKKDIEKVLEKNRSLSTIINCIGETSKNPQIQNLIEANSLFPQQLAEFLNTKKLKLIHISTDAVFNREQSNASEETHPLPDTLYGASKLLGEPQISNCIVVRTSILGLSRSKKSGLLDWARNQKAGSIEGYTNHQWSGCTSLQLGTFCHYLINNWDKIKLSKNRTIHFFPIKPISKYEILNSAKKVGIIDKKISKKVDGVTITRFLASNYFDKKQKSKYTFEITKALSELINFYNIHD